MEASLSLILSLAVVIFASQATAHSGGTDAYGCHAGSQPYHCHTPKIPYRVPDSVEPDEEEWTPSPRHRPSKNKVTAFYDKITESIAYGLRLIRKKPHIVKSCEEWVMVMKLMITINPITPKGLARLESKCYDNGHRRFGRYMVKLIERLPI